MKLRILLSLLSIFAIQSVVVQAGFLGQGQARTGTFASQAQPRMGGRGGYRSEGYRDGRYNDRYNDHYNRTGRDRGYNENQRSERQKHFYSQKENAQAEQTTPISE